MSEICSCAIVIKSSATIMMCQLSLSPHSCTSAGMVAVISPARARMLLTARLAMPSLASTVALPM